MQNFMENIEQWQPKRLSSLVTMAKAHYAISNVSPDNRSYTTDDIRTFLDFNQSMSLANSFYTFSKDLNFTFVFSNFIEVLKKTIIGKDIIAVVPCNENHFICITVSDVFGLLIEQSQDNPTIALLYVYCKNNSESQIDECSYEWQWKYAVNNFLFETFSVSILESAKEFIRKENPTDISEKVMLYAQYDSDMDTAYYELYVNDELILGMNYTLLNFPQVLKFYELLENICLAEYSKDPQKIYSIFCSTLINFDLMPGDVGEVAIASYDPDGEPNNNIVSSVDYIEGILICIRFTDDEGAHWYFDQNMWEYKNDELLIKSNKSSFNITTNIVIPNDDTLEEKISGLPNGYLSSATIGRIFNLATIKYIPMYFH